MRKVKRNSETLMLLISLTTMLLACSENDKGANDQKNLDGSMQNCPTTKVDGMNSVSRYGTITFIGKVSAVQTCSKGYCSEGKTIANIQLTQILVDCQKLLENMKLKLGSIVPINVTGKYKLVAGDISKVSCSVYSSCADGCVLGPNSLPQGPCWDFEFGCRTRCDLLEVTKQ